MKHINFSFLLAIFFLIVGANAFAYDAYIDGIYYKFSGTEATVTYLYYEKSSNSSAYSGNVVIPASVTYKGETYTVTSIGYSAFYGCSSLTSITIPESVTSIGSYAFYRCSSLISINIPEGITSISNCVFDGCSSLTSITIPNSVTSIGSNAFDGCSGLTSITIPNSVTSIGSYAFYGCRGLTSITIPESVTKINYEAFSGCTGLTSITIPESVTSIGNSAFSGCWGLTSITIPNSVTTIGESAFSGCSGLTSIAIPESLTSIGNGAFSDCSSLSSIKVSITDNALFINNRIAEQIKNHIGKNIQLIDGEGTEIKNFIVPDSVNSICDYAFYNCSGLTSITIPEGVTSIGDGVFHGCRSLCSITINCPTIGSWFRNLLSIKEITLGNNVTSIGNQAFSGCRGLTSINIPESVTSIGNSAFSGCIGLTSITIPEGVASIGNSTFAGCSGLTSISIPKGVTSIGNSAFSGCSGLTSITIPEGVTSIGNYAFYNCSGLTSLIIGSGVTSIGDLAFSTKPQKTIWLTNTPPEGYKNAVGVVNYVANNQFSSLPNSTVYPFLSSMFEVDGIKYVPVSPSERTCDAIDCVYDSLITDIHIGKGVAYKGIEMSVKEVKPYTCYNQPYITNGTFDLEGNIGNYAFYNCKALKEVTINNNGSIGEEAFYGCWTLKDVTITNTGAISSRAFENSSINGNLVISNNGDVCSSAFSNIGGNFTATVNNAGSIQDSAFAFSAGLQTLEIGELVTNINRWAFKGCNNLISVRTKQKGDIGNEAFANCYALQIVELSDSITSIGESAFSGCRTLVKIKLPDAVSTLGNAAFRGCSSLKSVDMGKGVSSIGNYAFSSCSSLPQIVLPQSLTRIDDYVFQGCSKLKTVVMEEQGSNAETRELSLGSNGSSPLFANCPLDSVYIGRNIAYSTESGKGYSPFYRNTSLRAVTITDKETEISTNEFYGCTNLKNVRVGDGVTTIGDWAFSGCSSLDYFAFGVRVRSIGKEAFSDCISVTQIISRAVMPPACGEQALDDINKWSCKLIVPKGKTQIYQGSFHWKEFFFIEEMDMGLVHTLTYFVDGMEYKRYKYEFDKPINPEPTPSKEGYTFSGWNEEPTTMPNQDVVVTGFFTINQYLVKYIVDGVVISERKMDYGSVIIVPDIEEKEGYTFSGWSEIPETVPAKDVTITGSYTINSYSLVYMVDGEVYKKSTVAFGTRLTKAAVPQKEGYTFSGWSDLPRTMPAHDVTITGTFTINKYKVTFIADGVVVSEETQDYHSKIQVPAAPEKEGYTFSGWGDVDETVPAHDVTYMATYSVNKYTIRYYVGDQLIAEDEVEYGAEVVLRNYTPEDADRYSFVGWEGEKYETMPAHDIEYHANIADGIMDLSSLNDVETIYNASGRKLSKLQRGVNVVVMKDGTKKKVVVK